MTTYVSSRLWPVLLMLTVLLAGAASLEIYLTRRDPRVIAMTIRADDTQAEGSDEEGSESEDEIVLDRSVPLNERQAAAREAGRRGDAKKAIELLRAELAAANSPQVAAELGYWLLAVKDPAQAVEVLRTAASAMPEDPHVELNLGVALRREGDLKGAREALQRAVNLRPSFSSAQLSLGSLLLASDEPQAAIEHLKAASASGGNDSRALALAMLGRAQLKSGQRAEAEASFHQAIEWAPAFAEIRISIARGFLEAGGKADRATAMSELERAVEIAPDLPRPHSLLGHTYELTGDKAAARKEFEATLHLDPGYSYARRRLIRMALDDEDFPHARLHVDALLQVSGELPEHLFLAGWVAAESGRIEDARRYYKQAIEKSSDHYPEALLNLGALEKTQKNYTEAVALYQRALAQKPDYVAAANNLGLVYVEMGKLGEAEQAYRDAIQINGHYAVAWFNLGSLKLDQQLWSDAIDAFKQALAIRPDYRSASLNLGIAYRQAKRIDEAVAIYRGLTAREPRYVRAWYNLGVALGFAERFAEARDAYLHALELDDEHWASLKNLAAVQQRLGQSAQARVSYEAFLDHSPTDAEARLGLASLLAQQGEAVNCVKQANLVLSSDPNNAEAQRQRQNCKAPR